MRFSEVSEHLKKFISLPEIAQLALISAAENVFREHQRAIEAFERAREETEARRLSAFRVRFPHFAPEARDPLSQAAAPGTYEDMLHKMYEQEEPFILESGVIKIRWDIQSTQRYPRRRDFVNMIRAELHRIPLEEDYQPINISIGYVTPDNRTFYRSFRADEVKAQGIEGLLNFLLIAEEDRDESLFHGSDVATEKP